MSWVGVMNERLRLLSRQIIESLRKGNVPRYGAYRFYHCKPIVRRIVKEDLDFVGSRGYVTKYFCGKYGSGKTLTLTLIRDMAHSTGLATSFVTLDPRAVTLNKLEVIYQFVFNNMAVEIDGEIKESSQAVNAIFYELCRKFYLDRRQAPPAFPEAPEMTDILHTFANKPSFRTHIVEWVMGKRHIPFTLKRQFGVKGDIDRTSCMSFLSAFCRILQNAGYLGLAILFDEVESTMQLWSRRARDTAYDNIRNLDENRYRIRNLYVAFGGTPEFFSDPERGVPSFPALNERIAHHWKRIRRSYRSPILMLDSPERKDYFLILRKVNKIYNEAYGSRIYIGDDLIHKNLTPLLKTGATPRQILRSFVAYLDQRADQLSI